MFATLVSLAVLSSAILPNVAAFNVQTINMTQCGDAHLYWDDTGASSYSVLLVNPSDPCGQEVFDLGSHTSHSMQWNVTALAGTDLQIYVESDSDDGWSGAITVASSSDYSCLPTSEQPASATSSVSLSSSIAATTLIVTPSAVESSAAATSSVSVVAVGAAGTDPIGGSNGATTFTANGPIMAVMALVGAYLFL